MAEYYHLRLSPPANAHEIRHCSCLAVPAERHGTLVPGDTGCRRVRSGDDLGRILLVVEREGVTLERILVTRGHIDHAGGVAELADRWAVC